MLNQHRRGWLTSVVAFSLVSLVFVATLAAATFSRWSIIRPAIAKVGTSVGTVVDSQGRTNTIKIVNFGSVVYTGPVNVKSTLDRVRANSKLPHDNDGSVFTNSGRTLPAKPSGYYTEFVHWPYGVNDRPYGMTFPGPMRVVLGTNGEVYFTGDHYSTFQNVR